MCHAQCAATELEDEMVQHSTKAFVSVQRLQIILYLYSLGSAHVTQNANGIHSLPNVSCFNVLEKDKNSTEDLTELFMWIISPYRH